MILRTGSWYFSTSKHTPVGKNEPFTPFSSKVFNTGIILGVCGIGIFTVMCIFEKKFRRKMGWDKLPCQDENNINACDSSIDDTTNTDNKEDNTNDLPR